MKRQTRWTKKTLKKRAAARKGKWYAHVTLRFKYEDVERADDALVDELVEHLLRPMRNAIIERKKGTEFWKNFEGWDTIDVQELIDRDDYLWTQPELIKKSTLRRLVESRNWDRR